MSIENKTFPIDHSMEKKLARAQKRLALTLLPLILTGCICKPPEPTQPPVEEVQPSIEDIIKTAQAQSATATAFAPTLTYNPGPLATPTPPEIPDEVPGIPLCDHTSFSLKIAFPDEEERTRVKERFPNLFFYTVEDLREEWGDLLNGLQPDDVILFNMRVKEGGSGLENEPLSVWSCVEGEWTDITFASP